MRQHRSVFMLTVRGSVYRLLGMLAVLAMGQGGLFWLTLRREAVEGSFSLEQVIQNSRVGWVLAAVFLLLTALLSWSCHELAGSYTTLRLSVSPRWVFFWQCVYNTLCYALLWAAEVLIAIGLCGLYVNQAAPEYVTGQTVFLAFHRNEFLHALLPFGDAFLWVRNAVFVLALGVCASRCPGARARARWSQLVLLAVALVFFVQEIGITFGGVFALMAAVFLAAVGMGKEWVRDDA